MSKVDELSGWVAEDHHAPTKVLTPIEIDDEAELELRPYHPVPPDRGACKFKLVRSPEEKNLAIVEVIEANWHPKFIAVLQHLRFQLAIDPVIGEYLVDPKVDLPDHLSMGTSTKWHVVEWKIVRTKIDARSLSVIELRDVIKWQDDSGNEAVSSYTWKPYPPRKTTPRLLSTAEWAPIEL